MKKIFLLVFLVLTLFTLVFVKAYRYDTLEKTAGLHRYVDRWTNTGWVKVTTATGIQRYAAKYYDAGKSTIDSTDNVIAELDRMRKTDVMLTAAWYVLTAGAAGLSVYVLRSRNGSRNKTFA